MLMERSKLTQPGPGEGFGHGNVAQVGRGADARHVLYGEDPGAFGEDLVDVSISRRVGSTALLRRPGPRRDYLAQRALQQAHTHIDAVGIVGDVQDVEQGRGSVVV
jgi:hypothetical protein